MGHYFRYLRKRWEAVRRQTSPLMLWLSWAWYCLADDWWVQQSPIFTHMTLHLDNPTMRHWAGCWVEWLLCADFVITTSCRRKRKITYDTYNNLCSSHKTLKSRLRCVCVWAQVLWVFGVWVPLYVCQRVNVHFLFFFFLLRSQHNRSRGCYATVK